jgi:antitoxin component YwqK of YwqJK toxin-antitoxin module
MKNIRINFILLFLSINLVGTAQRYFLCDSTISIHGDSILISSKCPITLNFSVLPDIDYDTLLQTTSDGGRLQINGTIEYKGDKKNNRGIYRVIRQGNIVQQCSFKNYYPDGWFKFYSIDNKSKSIIMKELHFKNGEKNGKSIFYSNKDRKKKRIEFYKHGQLLKRIDYFDKW